MRKKGEISTTRAAEMLGANEQTIQRHAKRAAEGDKKARFPREAVRKDWGGRWWIQRSEVERQLSQLTAPGGFAF